MILKVITLPHEICIMKAYKFEENKNVKIDYNTSKLAVPSLIKIDRRRMQQVVEAS